MHIPAKVDYGIRALLALTVDAPQTAEALAEAQGLPPRFLGSILAELRRGGLVASRRGADGGYRLARPPEDISLAEIIRVLDGRLALVRGARPDETHYEEPAQHLPRVWVAVRSALRLVLEPVTLAHVVSGELPEYLVQLTSEPDAWRPHWPPPAAGETGP